MKQANYAEARKLMKPGDVIAFGGTGAISSVIKSVTNSPVSHVGIVMHTLLQDGLYINQVIEANGKKGGLTGVQVWRMSDRLSEYEGSVWWLQVDVDLDAQHLVNFCMAQKSKKYDAPQAIGSAIDCIPDQKEDLSKLYCSELVAAALESAGVIGEINASEQTPADVVSFPVYSDMCQLKGELQDII